MILSERTHDTDAAQHRDVLQALVVAAIPVYS
jgi:rod shape determining protein RodA